MDERSHSRIPRIWQKNSRDRRKRLRLRIFRLRGMALDRPKLRHARFTSPNQIRQRLSHRRRTHRPRNLHRQPPRRLGMQMAPSDRLRWRTPRHDHIRLRRYPMDRNHRLLRHRLRDPRMRNMAKHRHHPETRPLRNLQRRKLHRQLRPAPRQLHRQRLDTALHQRRTDTHLQMAKSLRF